MSKEDKARFNKLMYAANVYCERMKPAKDDKILKAFVEEIAEEIGRVIGNGNTDS